MPNPARPPRLLVLRPYLSHAGRDDAYAHVDALVMHTRDGPMPRRYGELRPLLWHEDGARPILHEGFRFTCQIDDRHAEPYAPRYGYMPEHGEVFTTSDLARFGKPLAALRRGMARLVEQEGRSEDLGQILARLVEEDTPVSSADLVDWFAGWRRKAGALLTRPAPETGTDP